MILEHLKDEAEKKEKEDKIRRGVVRAAEVSEEAIGAVGSSQVAQLTWLVYKWGRDPDYCWKRKAGQ